MVIQSARQASDTVMKRHRWVFSSLRTCHNVSKAPTSCVLLLDEVEQLVACKDYVSAPDRLLKLRAKTNTNERPSKIPRNCSRTRVSLRMFMAPTVQVWDVIVTILNSSEHATKGTCKVTPSSKRTWSPPKCVASATFQHLEPALIHAYSSICCSGFDTWEHCVVGFRCHSFERRHANKCWRQMRWCCSSQLVCFGRLFFMYRGLFLVFLESCPQCARCAVCAVCIVLWVVFDGCRQSCACVSPSWCVSK